MQRWLLNQFVLPSKDAIRRMRQIYLRVMHQLVRLEIPIMKISELVKLEEVAGWVLDLQWEVCVRTQLITRVVEEREG